MTSLYMFDNSRHNIMLQKRQRRAKVISSLANSRQGKGRVKAIIYLKYTKLGISFFSIKEERKSVQMEQVFDGESILKI